MDDPRPAAAATAAAEAKGPLPPPTTRHRVLFVECASPSWSVVSISCGAAAGVVLLLLVAWMARQSRLTCSCRRRRPAHRGQPQPPLAPLLPPRPSPRILLLPPRSPVEDEGYVTPVTKTPALRHSYTLVLADDQQLLRGFSPDRVEDAMFPRPPEAWSGEPGYLPMRNYPYTSTCEQVLRILQENGIAVEMAPFKESPFETPPNAQLGNTSHNLTSCQPNNPGLKEPVAPYAIRGMNLHLKDFSEYVGQDQSNACPNTAYRNLDAEPLPCKTEPTLVQSRLLPPPPRPRPPASMALKKEGGNNCASEP